MHRSPLLIAPLLALLLPTLAFAADQPQEAKPAARVASIDLNDGTTVRGHVKGLKDGYYLIDTVSLGELRVSAQRIKGISYEPPVADKIEKPAAPAPAPKLRPQPPVAAPQVDNKAMQDMMQQMLGNPEIMQLIQQLSEDPSVQKMVRDPKLQKAVNGGNYLELLQHPSIRSLMDNPTVQQITDEVKSDGGAPAKDAGKAAK